MKKQHFILGVSNDLIGRVNNEETNLKGEIYILSGLTEAGRRIHNPSNSKLKIF